MGAIAEAIVAYAQPLLDQTDGSLEQMNKAMAISQACWALALAPENERDRLIREMQPTLQMNDDEFEDFRRSIIDPMIQRHQEMFPQMHQRGSTIPFQIGPGLPARASKEMYPGTDPYAPCPCKSGKSTSSVAGRSGVDSRWWAGSFDSMGVRLPERRDSWAGSRITSPRTRGARR
jgi:hypothetical protein